MKARVFSLALAAAAAAACRPPAAAPPAPPLLVRTATVQPRDLDQQLVLTGTLRPRAQVQVVAEVGGRLLRVARDEGARVAAGELLAQVDPTDYQLAGQRAAASLAVAQANRAHAQVEKERADNLVKTGGITDKDHLAAKVAVQVAEASESQAKSELAIADRQMERSRITAPIGGRISKRHADAGTVIAAGTPLYTIVDDSVFEFRSSVASGDFGMVKVGEPVVVTVDALPGFVTDGQVNRIAPQVDARSRSFEIIIRVPGKRELVSGLFARAQVKVREVPGSLTVPPAALLRDGSDPTKAQTYVVKNNTVERRDVVVGVEVPDAVQVTSGLNVGEVVVVDPPSALGPGTQVQVERATKAGS